MELHTGLAGNVLLYNAFFLGTANLIGTAGSYFQSAMRQNFLSQKQLQDMAEKDFLTGLLNRRAFSTRADLHLAPGTAREARTRRCDDGCRFFQALQRPLWPCRRRRNPEKVAHVMGSHARRPLDIVARYGGEEFVGLWYNLSEADMQTILESLRTDIAALQIPHATSDVAPHVSVSIGLAYLQPLAHHAGRCTAPGRRGPLPGQGTRAQPRGAENARGQLISDFGG